MLPSLRLNSQINVKFGPRIWYLLHFLARDPVFLAKWSELSQILEKWVLWVILWYLSVFPKLCVLGGLVTQTLFWPVLAIPDFSYTITSRTQEEDPLSKKNNTHLVANYLWKLEPHIYRVWSSVRNVCVLSSKPADPLIVYIKGCQGDIATFIARI